MAFPIFYDGRTTKDFELIDNLSDDGIPADEAREVIKAALDAERQRRVAEVDQ